MSQLEFCKNCGKILEISNIEGKQIGICKCGFKKQVKADIIPEKIKRSSVKGNGIATNEKHNSADFPHKCKKCGFEKAEVIDLGAQLADEANIHLFKCGKCSNVERQSDGSCNL